MGEAGKDERKVEAGIGLTTIGVVHVCFLMGVFPLDHTGDSSMVKLLIKELSLWCPDYWLTDLMWSPVLSPLFDHSLNSFNIWKLFVWGFENLKTFERQMTVFHGL